MIYKKLFITVCLCILTIIATVALGNPLETVSYAYLTDHYQKVNFSVTHSIYYLETEQNGNSDYTNSDYLDSSDWGLQAIEASKVWLMGIKGDGITIAVVDTGVNNNIGDLKGNVIHGYNALTGGTDFIDTEDSNGHGTQVASIIASNGKGLGLNGIAPSAKIMPIKVFDSSGEADVKNISLGIRWAADHGAKIINLSFGSNTSDTALLEAIKYAQAIDCLIIAAAGNHSEGENTNILYPASYSGVVSVGALNKDFKLSNSSNSGNGLTFVAPGTQILVDSIDQNRLIFTDGTSYAAPFVSGIAALIWSAHPEWSAQQVLSNMEQSAQRLDKNGRSSQYGFGLPNAYRAIKIGLTNTMTAPATVDYGGGIIKDTVSGAALNVSPLIWNTSNSINIKPFDLSPSFPSGIILGSKIIQVSWDTSETHHKNLSLTIPVVNQSSMENYLFRWDSSRWICISGGNTGKTHFYYPFMLLLGHGDPKGKNEWIHPDLVGLEVSSIKDFSKGVLSFSKQINQTPIGIFSFELKRKIEFSNLRLLQ